MNAEHEKRLRAMLEAKRHFDAAWQAGLKARAAYTRAQDNFLGMFSESSPPGPIICGNTFISLVSAYKRADVEFKFEFTEAERCPTSE